MSLLNNTPSSEENEVLSLLTDISARAVHPSKALYVMFETLSGIKIFVSFLQPENDLYSMLFNQLDIVIAERFSQPLKASFSIVLTFSGIVMLSRLLQQRKDCSGMLSIFDDNLISLRA